MPLLLLVFLCFVCMLDEWPAAPWGGSPWIAVALTAAAVTFTVLSAAFLSRRLGHARSADEFDQARYERYRGRHQLLLFALYALALVLFGWGHAVGALWRFGDQRPFTEIILLVPF